MGRAVYGDLRYAQRVAIRVAVIGQQVAGQWCQAVFQHGGAVIDHIRRLIRLNELVHRRVDRIATGAIVGSPGEIERFVHTQDVG